MQKLQPEQMDEMNDATAILTNKTISATDNTITDLSAVNITDRVRMVSMFTRADGTGGAVETNNMGPGTAFSGTPTGYVRGYVTIPNDYASGDVLIKLVTRSSAVNTSETTTTYVACHASGGDTTTAWNVINGSAGSQSWAANTLTIITITAPEADVAAGDNLFFAWRITSALSGTVYVESAYIEYTADS